MTKNRSLSQGFTLVETLVAVSIIVLVVTGPLAVSSRSISAGVFARTQITASLLAQEGMEIVRNIRDRDQLASNQWMAAFTSKDCVRSGGVEKNCVIDAGSIGASNPELAPCPTAITCPVLKFVSIPLGGNLSGGFYSQNPADGGVDSIFTRKVTILRPDPAFDTQNKEAIARVTVSWLSLGAPKSLVVEEELFKLYDSSQ